MPSSIQNNNELRRVFKEFKVEAIEEQTKWQSFCVKDGTGEVCFDLDLAKDKNVLHRITVQKKLSPMITVSTHTKARVYDGCFLANPSKFLKTMFTSSIYKVLIETLCIYQDDLVRVDF